MPARGNKVKKNNLVLLILVSIALAAVVLCLIFLLKYCQRNPLDTGEIKSAQTSNPPGLVERTPAPGKPSAEKKPTSMPTAKPEAPGPPAVPAGFRDDFNRTTLDTRWFWVREKPVSWSLETQPGFLTIVCDQGDLYESHNDNSNTLLSKTDAPDFQIETKVNLKPLADFEQAGLVIYYNDDNYVKLIRIFSEGSKVELLCESRGKGSSPIQLLSSASTVYLRLVKKGSSYTGFYSTNGADYRRVGSFTLTGQGAPKAGLIAFSLASGRNVKAAFDYFQISY
jgi:beta-xylosidase